MVTDTVVCSLSSDGLILNGIDRFEKEPDYDHITKSVAVRFHLSPQLKSTLLGNNRSVLMAAPDGEAWTFTSEDADLALEESMRFTGPEEPRRCVQIVIYGDTRANSELRWTMTRRTKKTRSKAHEAKQDSPDLLDGL